MVLSIFVDVYALDIFFVFLCLLLLCALYRYDALHLFLGVNKYQYLIFRLNLVLVIKSCSKLCYARLDSLL